MNSVNMVGYVARDPDMYGDSDSPTVGRFSMSVPNREYIPEEKAQGNVDRWFDFVGFGFQAKGIQAVVRPGRKIAVVGYLTNDTYTTDEGEERRSCKIVVEKLSVIDWGDDERNRAGSTESVAEEELVEDEFPF